MNTNLEKIFNLGHTDPAPLAPAPEPEPTVSMITELTKSVGNLDKINEALPQVVGLEASEREMDDLARMATEGYQNLMELGMNVETRFASEIFSAAGGLLGTALAAKTAKINKKLKMIELQLRKAALDQRAADFSNSVPVSDGVATVIDRNALVAEILKKKDTEAK